MERSIGKTASTRLSLLLSVALLLCAGCGRATDRREAGRAITDLYGRDVTVPEDIARVVALGPGALRFVVYLGAADMIVGIEDMEKRMEATRLSRPYAQALDRSFMDLPVVSSGGPGNLPNFEGVITCRPDLIIAVSFDAGQVDNIQEKTGIPTIALSYGALGVWREEAKTSLRLLGEVLGRTNRAEEVIAYVESAERDLAKRTVDTGEGKRAGVFFGGISFKGSHGLTSTEGGYAPGEMVNARNLADTVAESGHLFVDREQLLLWDPDVIFVDLGSSSHVEEDFRNNPGFYRNLGAVRNNRVFSLLPYNYYNTNIELALLNAYFIGKTLYPVAFADVDIADKADEIYSTFPGIHAPENLSAYRAIRFDESNNAIVW
jgi:iron complex transport system substrate-binding protein